MADEAKAEVVAAPTTVTPATQVVTPPGDAEAGKVPPADGDKVTSLLSEATTKTPDDGQTAKDTKDGDGKTVEKAETPEQKEAREKAELEAKNKAVPEKYEIKAPEGMTVDTALIDGLTPVFKELGLSQESVQKLADVYAPIIKSQVEARIQEQVKNSVDEFKQTVEGWKQDTIKELGANAAKEMAFAAKVLDTFGTPELRALLAETGVGNHPEFVKCFIKAGKMLGEDTFVEPGSHGVVKTGINTDALYPTLKKS